MGITYLIEKIKIWEHTNIFKNSGERSNLMSLDSSLESDAGSTDNFQSSIRSKDHQDWIRPEPSDSSKSKDTLSTELESEEVEERELSIRVSSMVSQSMEVSESSRKLDPTDPSLRRRLVENAPTSESSTPIGLDKTLPTNSLRSSALIQTIMPSRKTQESTGSFLKNTTKENSEVSPPPVRNIEVSDKRDTELITEDHQSDPHGEERTAKSSEEAEIQASCFICT